PARVPPRDARRPRRRAARVHGRIAARGRVEGGRLGHPAQATRISPAVGTDRRGQGRGVSALEPPDSQARALAEDPGGVVRMVNERTKPMRGVRAIAIVAAAAAACMTNEYVVVPEPVVVAPPLVPPSAGRKALRPPPQSFKFRVAVLDFIDQTNAAGDLVR